MRLALVGVLMTSLSLAANAAAANPKALILGTTVTPGTATDGSGKSLEQQQAEADGFTVTVVGGATWDAMSASDFAQYRVLIIGDPTCQGDEAYAPAQTNASVWQPVVMASGGNKVLIGTDATLHNNGPSGTQRGDLLEKKGIAFAGHIAGATGAYIDTSCEFSDSDPVDGQAPPGTPVPIMDGLSTHGPAQFTAGGAPCAGDISIVASSGPTAGLHDADLSNWSCSVHAFFDKFPSDWTPLALATDPSVPKIYSARDVDTGATVSGSPYILVSGAGIVVTSHISLTPAAATNPVGGDHTVTATITKSNGDPVPGKTVTFSVDSGPNAGKTGTGVTNSNGRATFTYHDDGGAGTDSISAQFTNDAGAIEKDTATKTWTRSTGGGPVWEGFHTDPSSGCSARVQQPYLDANQQVTSYTEVICPKATQLTIRSRLRSDHRFDRPLFRNITVAQKGCLRADCVVNQPKGKRFYKLTCPKSSTRTFNQDYFTDIILYAGTHKPAVTPFPQRSRPATLSPYCAY